jgi:hypothetical protein
MTRSTLPAWNLGHTTGPLRWARFADADGAPVDGGTDAAEEPEGSDEDPSGETGDDAEQDEDPEGSDKLGDPGKKALESMKAKWKAERKARQDLQAKLDKADPDKDSERERAVTEKANQRILRSEVKAAAAGKLADPKDALRFLDLTKFEVDEDGDVDEDEIADAIADLLTKKPYLAAQGERRFKGSADGGVRKESRPKQVTRTELGRMTPAQILKAQDEGRLADLLKSKN